MKFIPAALLLISTPLWAADISSNELTVKASLFAGTCDITAPDVIDLGDVDVSVFAAGGALANVTADEFTVSSTMGKRLLVDVRCDPGINTGTILSFKPQKAPLTGNRIFPNEYTGPIGRITAPTAARNVGVVIFFWTSISEANVLNEDNSSNGIGCVVNFSPTAYTRCSFLVRYQKVDLARPVTAGGVLSQLQIRASYQ